MRGEDVGRTCKDDSSVAERDFITCFFAVIADTDLGPEGPNSGRYCTFVFLSSCSCFFLGGVFGFEIRDLNLGTAP